MLKHFFSLMVDFDAVGRELLSCPFEVFREDIADADELCLRNVMESVQGMLSAHTTYADNADVELLWTLDLCRMHCKMCCAVGIDGLVCCSSHCLLFLLKEIYQDYT